MSSMREILEKQITSKLAEFIELNKKLDRATNDNKDAVKEHIQEILKSFDEIRFRLIEEIKKEISSKHAEIEELEEEIKETRFHELTLDNKRSTEERIKELSKWIDKDNEKIKYYENLNFSKNLKGGKRRRKSMRRKSMRRKSRKQKRTRRVKQRGGKRHSRHTKH